MGFDISVSVPATVVFLQGLLSFFSPCVLPLVPLYVGYLAGGTAVYREDGTVEYGRRKVLLNTLFFILGISFAFLILTMGFTAAGQFFSGNQLMLARIGGIVVILFGLLQLGVLGKGLEGERRLSLNLSKLTMNPLVALLMGFVFSFAWTPCVGPTLASVLLLVSSAQSVGLGYLLMGLYTLGFTLPFLAVGLFTTSVLNFFQKHKNFVSYTTKIGGGLMVVLGIMMVTGWMNGVTGYLSSFEGISLFEESNTSVEQVEEEQSEIEPMPEPTVEPEEEVETEAEEEIPAPDFTLVDQYGESHTLSDYQGKVVFLNFWATWCPPCKAEMPDIQRLYENYGYNEEDVIVLGVAFPKSDQNTRSSEGTVEEVAAFLEENSYSYPVVMDEMASLQWAYGISAFPTTFMIDVEGNVYGYLAGMMSYEIMEDIIAQTQGG